MMGASTASALICMAFLPGAYCLHSFQVLIRQHCYGGSKLPFHKLHFGTCLQAYIIKNGRLHMKVSAVVSAMFVAVPLSIRCFA